MSNTAFDTTEVEQSDPEARPAKARTELTPAQKEAGTKRREASVLRKHANGNSAIIKQAEELEAAADKLAPTTKQGRVDPLKVLDNEDQGKLKSYFRTAAGFAWVCGKVSAAKLEELAESLP